MAVRVMRVSDGGSVGVAGSVLGGARGPGNAAGRRGARWRWLLHGAGLLTLLFVAGPVRAQEVAPIEQQVCSECHETARLRTSIHGSEDVACLACHSVDSHREMPRDSAVAAHERSTLCAECHTDLQPTHTRVGSDAPVCTDCHVVHTDPPVAEAVPLFAARCGACHQDELTAFTGGAHAASIDPAGPNPDVPSCQTCHPSHDPAFSTRRGARLEATALCIKCHSDELLIGSYDLPEFAAASYEDDFHGTTLDYLWSHPDNETQPGVLVCSDCHGEHDVAWLAKEDVVGVCLECHEEADERIAGAWIGHDKVGPKNAVLIWAIRLFYYSFVPIVLGGLILNIMIEVGHHRRQKRQGGGPSAHGHGPEANIGVTRFSLSERIEHFLAMSSFTLLVVTGLPQLWPRATVSDALIGAFGGIGSTRIIHRATGVLFIALLALHVVRALVRAIQKKRLPIMFAKRKDFTDTIQTVRYFLGIAPPPRIGKFDFRAKFEYWGLFLGGTLMSVTGIMLLLPELVSWVVPGSVIAAGRVLHGLEGTFAVLVVILWHTWTVILRPEIFPLDKSIFTGKIALARLREEHPLEYERIFGTESEGDTVQSTGATRAE